MLKISNDAQRKTRQIRFVLIAVISSVFFLGLVLVPGAALHDGPQDTLSAGNASSDDVTRAIRDRSIAIIRVVVRSAADREVARKMGVLIEDYGSYVVIAGANNQDFAQFGLESSRIETTVNLPGKTFDPLQEPPVETIKANADGSNSASNRGSKDYFVVQFAAPVRDEWLDGLRSFGVDVLQYVPHQSFFVYADNETMQRVANHSRVRWVGRYMAEAKIAPELREQIAAQLNGTPSSGKMQPLEVNASGLATFDVAIFARANLDDAQAAIANIYGTRVKNVMRLPHNFFNVLRIELPLGAVGRVAEIPDVVRVDPYFTPTKEDERAAQIVAGNYTSTTVISPPGYNPLSQFGVDGSGVSVSVVDDGVGIPGDGGFYVTATNTANGPLRGAAAGANGHGHLNASIIAGNTPFSVLDPTGYNYGLGIAPNAHIVNIPFLRTGYTGAEVNTIDDTITSMGPNGVKCFITNNSWGNGTNGNSYDAYAGMYDGFVQDGSLAATIDPILIVFSAGNSGASGLTRPKVAKNVIAVANSKNLRTELSASASNMDDIDSSSSRGLAADGRIKPDITAPGSAITGGRSGTSSLFGNIDTFHRWSTGTSHAAPQVAGAAALFTQFWKNANGGSNPSPALAKAAIINTGQEMNGVLSTNPIPNGNEGWGRINMKLMLNPGVPIKYINQTHEFSNPGEAFALIGKVSSAAKPVRITLVWTDPPGVGNPALVNNLDLTVTVNGNTYKGNVFTAGTSTTGSSYDTLNNVENVFLPAGIASGSVITISVSSVALNGNGILGNADATDQHFALVAYNFATSSQAKPFDFDGDNKSDVAVFRNSESAWYVLQSSTNTLFARPGFGLATDLLAPADYDGDRKSDIAVWRPSDGTYYLIQSSDSSYRTQPFGSNGDVPVPADYDGDGKADVAVFRPTDGTWYIYQSLSGSVRAQPFGISTDKPVPADYDGDGKADLAVYRQAGGIWYVLRSSDSTFIAQPFGVSSDVPVVGDYDGDGKTDFAVFRPSTNTWYVLQSSNGAISGQVFGTGFDVPSPGDFDGDGKTDIAVFRSSDGTWYILQSMAGFRAQQFGLNGDRPVEAAYIQ